MTTDRLFKLDRIAIFKLDRIAMFKLDRIAMFPKRFALISNNTVHPGLTRVRGIRFLQFEIILVLIYILTIFKVTDSFVKYFLFKTYMPAKKYIRKKAEKLCLIGVIVIESHSFLKY